MNRKALAIDANLERVLARFFYLREEKGPRLQKTLTQLFERGEILSDMEKWGPRQFHEALMDVGRDFCKARSTDCPSCPLFGPCQGSKLADAMEIPFISAKEKVQSSAPVDLTLLRIVVRRGGSLLGYVKGPNQWLSGQIEVPTLVLSCDDSHFKQYPRYRGREFAFGKRFAPDQNWHYQIPRSQSDLGDFKKRISNLRTRYRQGVPLFQFERRTPLLQCHCKNSQASFLQLEKRFLNHFGHLLEVPVLGRAKTS